MHDTICDRVMLQKAERAMPMKLTEQHSSQYLTALGVRHSYTMLLQD